LCSAACSLLLRTSASSLHALHAHARVPLLLSLLSSCLGKIEVIILIQL